MQTAYVEIKWHMMSYLMWVYIWHSLDEIFYVILQTKKLSYLALKGLGFMQKLGVWMCAEKCNGGTLLHYIV